VLLKAAADPVERCGEAESGVVGGLTTKNHLVCDGKGRALAFILAPGQVADTIMMAATLEQIRVPIGRGRSTRLIPQRSRRSVTTKQSRSVTDVLRQIRHLCPET
jgi:hypothetical protein